MKEIFKQIDSWLQKAKDRKSGCNVATSKAFYGGQVSAYINVGLLLQEHITQQAVQADVKSRWSICHCGRKYHDAPPDLVCVCGRLVHAP